MGPSGADAEMGLPAGVTLSAKLCRVILNGFTAKIAHSPADGTTIEDLVKKTALSINLAAIEPQFVASGSHKSGSADKGAGRMVLSDPNSAGTDREELDVRKWALGTR